MTIRLGLLPAASIRFGPSIHSGMRMFSCSCLRSRSWHSGKTDVSGMNALESDSLADYTEQQSVKDSLPFKE